MLSEWGSIIQRSLCDSLQHAEENGVVLSGSGESRPGCEAAECILLFGPQDVQIQKLLIEESVSSPLRQAMNIKSCKPMVDYCHASRCLRKTILAYFGEENVMERCGNCSNCEEQKER
jgi:superfamily II DNA helicase RecQ